MIDFPKVFWDFRKWTFIFVHFLLSEKGFGAKNRIFAMLVGTFGIPQICIFVYIISSHIYIYGWKTYFAVCF